MKRTILAVAIMWALANQSGAQSVPLHFGAANPVHDEFGQLLRGTSEGAASFNKTVILGDLVQVLSANVGVFPPDANGQSNPANAVMTTIRVGSGVDPTMSQSGLFSGSVDGLNRGDPNSVIKIFVRVFNAPAVEQASFYADSDVFTVPVWGQPYGIFKAAIGATTQEVDSSDADMDGLSRSWERSYGSNPDDPDTDKDGMLDGNEIRAGTGVTDPSSLLQMVWLTPMSGGDLQVQWDSVPGKTYQVQYTTNNLAQSPEFEDVGGPVTATGNTSDSVITDGSLPNNAHFRVVLVE